jgi:simple sugar transport system ATP-binding protein
LNGKSLKIKIPQHSVENRIGMVPEERRKEGVMVDEPVYFNLSAASLLRFCNRIRFVKKKAEMQNAVTFIQNLGIKTPSEKQYVRYLSGGNQQKVVIGKWLSADCDVYIFDEPTKGIDVGAKREIFTLIQDIAKAGKSVIYATCETTEILTITDRVYVMYDGRVTKELVTSETNESEIMFYSTGTGGN